MLTKPQKISQSLLLLRSCVSADHVWRLLDSKFLRPAEVDLLIGDPSKARKQLSWEPKTSFKDLVRIMVDADIKALDEEMKGRAVRVDN
jgi:GDP-D-mannose dehydratase